MDFDFHLCGLSREASSGLADILGKVRDRLISEVIERDRREEQARQIVLRAQARSELVLAVVARVEAGTALAAAAEALAREQRWDELQMGMALAGARTELRRRAEAARSQRNARMVRIARAGKSNATIAAAYGMSVSAVGRIVARGLRGEK